MTTRGPSTGQDQLFHLTPAEYGPDFREHVLKQYRLAVERADAVSDRRASMNEFYLVLSSVILSVAGVGIGGTLAESPAIPPKLAPWISIAGAVVSIAWLAGIYSANQLNRAKFYVINRLEEQLPAAVFSVEWNYRTSGTEAPSKATGRLYTSSTYVESVVPALLLILYLAFAAYLFLNP